MSKKKAKFTPEYFIEKFEAIPEDRWATGSLENYRGCRCALGHCGVLDLFKLTPEAVALAQILRPVASQVDTYVGTDEARVVYAVNDRDYEFGDLGSSPKERIINALTLAASGALKDVQ